MRPFKQRQYWDKPPWGPSLTMYRCMDFIERPLDFRLERQVRVAPDARPALVIATVAQVEPRHQCQGGSAWRQAAESALRCSDDTAHDAPVARAGPRQEGCVVHRQHLGDGVLR